MKSTLDHLECTACDAICSAEEPHRTCPTCGKVLFARYDLARARRALSRTSLARRVPSLWRYFELLPVRHPDSVCSLGEGMTPLLSARRLGAQLGCRSLFIKEEGVNPTGTFKARGLAAAVSRARELGLSRLAIPSAGNAGGALAAYCARAGMEAHVFLPRDVPDANRSSLPGAPFFRSNGAKTAHCSSVSS
ncbi:MAG: pyridoxal-phosphate dependent enzyme [Chloroflexi bacterium]|nr:pyridoxal-phosphate dependent enzyme [Chloroflexota bacterium]